MKKINDVLTNYFSLNLLSTLGNLSLLLILYYFFISYPIITLHLPDNVDSFDIFYGIVMELCRIFEHIVYVYLVLIIFAIIEFVIKIFVKYQTLKIFKNKVYIIFFDLGLLITSVFWFLILFL